MGIRARRMAGLVPVDTLLLLASLITTVACLADEYPCPDGCSCKTRYDIRYDIIVHCYNQSQIPDLPGSWPAIFFLPNSDTAHPELPVTELELDECSFPDLPPGGLAHLHGLKKLVIKDHETPLRLYNTSFEGLDNFQFLLLVRVPIDQDRLPPGIFSPVRNSVRLLFLQSIDIQGDVLEQLGRPWPNLTNLALIKMALGPLRPDSFHGMTTLQHLGLTNCEIASLPEGVFDRLHDLEVLELYNNNLTELSADVFIHQGALISLDLHNNQLRSLAPGVFGPMRSLRFLGLNNNNLTEVASGVFTRPVFENLHEIWLEGNALDCRTVRRLNETLEEVFAASDPPGGVYASWVFEGLARAVLLGAGDTCVLCGGDVEETPENDICDAVDFGKQTALSLCKSGAQVSHAQCRRLGCCFIFKHEDPTDVDGICVKVEGSIIDAETKIRETNCFRNMVTDLLGCSWVPLGFPSRTLCLTQQTISSLREN